MTLQEQANAALSCDIHTYIHTYRISSFGHLRDRSQWGEWMWSWSMYFEKIFNSKKKNTQKKRFHEKLKNRDPRNKTNRFNCYAPKWSNWITFDLSQSFRSTRHGLVVEDSIRQRVACEHLLLRVRNMQVMWIDHPRPSVVRVDRCSPPSASKSLCKTQIKYLKIPFLAG